MTTPSIYSNASVPVKYFLNSYRALTDARSGIRCLDDHVTSKNFLLSEWKVIWIGVCSVLRVAVTLFKVDAASCINGEIRRQIEAEWKFISSSRDDHPIFWKFLWEERNNVLHQYEWKAYEAWMREDGTIDVSRRSLLTRSDDVRNVLLMRGGHYDGQNSLELLREGADWVETRIFNAIKRAGFDPEESRTLGSFNPAPSTMILSKSLLSGTEIGK